ncbi:MAG TPA: lipocalin-like domain-containing protein, partial [Burkholderiales bacterium]|nr:lipocalin-like domain-containing protein [Burkholderiales bacterium]
MAKVLAAVVLMAAVATGSPLLAQQPAQARASAALAMLLQKDAEGFASASAPWRFRFPADHGAHPAYRSESWRFSGSVATREGRRFGFQLTFLRVGINPPATPVGPSAWAAKDVYWAQFAVSDAAGNRQYEFEQLTRAAMEMSGAESSPVRVWVRDWVMEMRNADGRDAGFGLRASQDDASIELSLHTAKPAVTRTAGDPRPHEPASTNRFHAYLVTRLTAKGIIRVGEHVWTVEGIAWLDRAWGEVPLPIGALVWDRFLLQLDDARDLMVLRLRRRDGSGEPLVTGLLVERDGSARTLEAGRLALDAVDQRWRLRMSEQRLELYLDPYVRMQEKSHSLQSWSAVHIRGTAEGQGYVELAAYAASGSR